MPARIFNPLQTSSKSVHPGLRRPPRISEGGLFISFTLQLLSSTIHWQNTTGEKDKFSKGFYQCHFWAANKNINHYQKTLL